MQRVDLMNLVSAGNFLMSRQAERTQFGARLGQCDRPKPMEAQMLFCQSAKR